MNKSSGFQAGSWRRRLVPLIVGVVAAVGMAGCAPAATTGGDDDRTLVIAHPADPASLYGLFHTVQRDLNIAEQITEKLVEFSTDADTIEPRLAESWVVEENAVVLTLRKEVTFTNGEPFDSTSAVFSLNTMLNSDVYKSFTDSIDRVEARDEHTVAVYAKGAPDLALLSLALGSFQLPPDYFEETGPDGFSANPIGTGPYLFESWTKGVAVKLAANENYWDGGAPYYEDIEFRIIVDPSAQVSALLAGEVDLVTDFPRGSTSQLADSDAGELVSRPSNRIIFMSFNTLTDGPLRDPLVRQAIAHAIDTDVVIDIGAAGHGVSLDGQIIPSNWTGYDSQTNAIEYDPPKAKKLLAEAGYPNGFAIPLEYSVSQQKDVWPVIAEQLAEIGITVELELMEPGTFIQAFVAKDLNGLMAQAVLPPPDAHFMYQRHRTGAVTSYYSNVKLDELIAAGMAATNTEDRMKTYADINEVFVEDPPFVPLFQGEDLYGVSPHLKGFVPTATQFLDLRVWGK